MPSPYKNTSRWRANWRDKDGKQHSQNFADFDSALAHEKAMKAEREAEAPSACGDCGTPIEQSGVPGRRRQFCDDCAGKRRAKSVRASKRAATERKPLPAAVRCANPDCDEIVEPRRGTPRKFHSPECQAAYWRTRRRPGEPEPQRPLTDHVITIGNEELKLGLCSQCGPVIAWRIDDKHEDGRPRLRWRCPNASTESRRAAVKRYQATPGGRVRKMVNRGVSDITVARLAALEAECGGICPVCERAARLHLDHDHDTRATRGLLCVTCNTGIGKLGDTLDGLWRAFHFLHRPPIELPPVELPPPQPTGGKRGPRSEMHRITEVDEATKRAVCSKCGPVTVYRFSNAWICSERVKARQAGYRGTERYGFNKNRSRGYEITPSQQDWLLQQQAGRCALCEEPMREPQTHHDHATGGVHGLLCVTCNTGLGKLGDDPARLTRAIAYLMHPSPALAVHPEIEAAFAEACPPTDDPHEAPF